MKWYAFYHSDYKADTIHLPDDEDLAYRRLLDIYSGTERPLPIEPEACARLIRMTGKLDAVKQVLCEFWKLTDAGWENKRAKAEIEKANAISEKRAEAAKSYHKARQEQGKSKAIEKQPECKSSANAEQPECKSIDNHNHNHNHNIIPPLTSFEAPLAPGQAEPPPETAPQAAPDFPGVLNCEEFRAEWARYEQHRRQNKWKKLKPMSVAAQLKTLQGYGLQTAIHSVKSAIANGYQGIFRTDPHAQSAKPNGRAIRPTPPPPPNEPRVSRVLTAEERRAIIHGQTDPFGCRLSQD